MLNQEDSSMAANAICHAAYMVKEEFLISAGQLQRPSVLRKPKVFIDGNKWCVLYGENLQDGVAGFGDSPEEAAQDFDKNWNKPLAP